MEHHDQEILLIRAGEDEPAQLLHLHSDLYLMHSQMTYYKYTAAVAQQFSNADTVYLLCLFETN